MTKIIGLTGGIGSGKTMIADYIKSLGIPIYIADDEARGLMDEKEIINAIINEFGKEVQDNGKLNRKKIAELVFDNPNKLEKLNNIVHPAVRKHFADWLKRHNEFPLIVKETAILFESGSFMDCDAIITVTAPIEIRIQRIIERDKTDREAVLKRMQNQWGDEKKIAKSDYVIHNVSVEDSKKQIDKILNLLINQ